MHSISTYKMEEINCNYSLKNVPDVYLSIALSIYVAIALSFYMYTYIYIYIYVCIYT